MIGLLVAILAIIANDPAGEFTRGVLAHCEPVVTVTFVGCEALDWTQDETLFAGLVWRDDGPALVTGP